MLTIAVNLGPVLPQLSSVALKSKCKGRVISFFSTGWLVAAAACAILAVNLTLSFINDPATSMPNVIAFEEDGAAIVRPGSFRDDALMPRGNIRHVSMQNREQSPAVRSTFGLGCGQNQSALTVLAIHQRHF